ncbi:MAG: hypothetical protein O2821_13685 [Chloroflexi bacterium]|nr:hypothetical protein [Chloroflexota bacterium]MDA1227769.1 hypothetical protein [Chloroflexota bacterium]
MRGELPNLVRHDDGVVDGMFQVRPQLRNLATFLTLLEVVADDRATY